MKLTWKEPPAPASGNGRPPLMDYDALVAELKARPGEWALIFTNKNSWHTEPLRRRGLETRTVSAGLGYAPSHADIYARWTDEIQTNAA